MKRLWKSMVPALTLLLVMGLFSLRDASIFYKGPVSEGLQEYYVNKVSRQAYAGSYLWDGDPDHMTIVIPEQVRGVPVTSLGGYTGSGAPVFFGVTLPDAYRSTLAPQEGTAYDEELVFTVAVGKNLRQLAAVDMGYDTTAVRPGAVVQYHISYVYRCDEENPVFYAQNGQLYRRSDHQPAFTEKPS